MPLTKEQVLDKLNAAGVQYESYEHAAALTVDAQVQALPGNPTGVIKNLFVKDKKHRCYVLSALAATKIDLQVLSARLGTGKGGLRLAPEELLGSVLGVAPGSVTPLVVANSEAADVVLLLDKSMQVAEQVWLHPLVNTATLAMVPSCLDTALRAFGREPLYVDFEIEPKIDRENPPDLKHIADAAQAPAAALPQEGAAVSSSPAPPAVSTTSSVPAKDWGKKAKSAPADQKPAATAVAAAAAAAAAANHMNVGGLTESLLEMVSTALTGKGSSGTAVEPYVLARLKADMESQVNALKNASYAAGYAAGKGEIVAHAQRTYA